MQRQIKAEPVESGGSQAAAAGVLGLSVKREDENGGAVVFTSTTEFTSRLEVRRVYCTQCQLHGQGFVCVILADFRRESRVENFALLRPPPVEMALFCLHFFLASDENPGVSWKWRRRPECLLFRKPQKLNDGPLCTCNR